MRGFLVVFLVMEAFASALGATGPEDERLIGWNGETFLQQSMRRSAQTIATTVPWIEAISWSPRAFVYHHFLSDLEADHLVNISIHRLERSMVVGEKGDTTDPIRTSFSASLGRNQDEIVSRIEQRIAEWTHLPEENGEPIEVLRYVNGQKYDAHNDWFEVRDMKDDNNRVATVLMYLSGVLPNAGGETALPLATPLDEDAPLQKGLSACASRMGISVVPSKGDALLFWDMQPGALDVDRHALHASCPTSAGTKWTATKWIHMRRYY